MKDDGCHYTLKFESGSRAGHIRYGVKSNELMLLYTAAQRAEQAASAVGHRAVIAARAAAYRAVEAAAERVERALNWLNSLVALFWSESPVQGFCTSA